MSFAGCTCRSPHTSGDSPWQLTTISNKRITGVKTRVLYTFPRQLTVATPSRSARNYRPQHQGIGQPDPDDHQLDTSGLSLEECAAIWMLQKINQLVIEFRDCWEYNEYASTSWTFFAIKLSCRLHEIELLSNRQCRRQLKETPQAKHHCRSKSFHS